MNVTFVSSNRYYGGTEYQLIIDNMKAFYTVSDEVPYKTTVLILYATRNGNLMTDSFMSVDYLLPFDINNPHKTLETFYKHLLLQ